MLTQETSVRSLTTTGTGLGKAQAFSPLLVQWGGFGRSQLWPDVLSDIQMCKWESYSSLACALPRQLLGKLPGLCLLPWRSCPGPRLLPELRLGPAHARPSLTSVDVLSHHAEIVLPEATGGESRRAEPQAAGTQGADITCTRTSHA